MESDKFQGALVLPSSLEVYEEGVGKNCLRLVQEEDKNSFFLERQKDKDKVLGSKCQQLYLS